VVDKDEKNVFKTLFNNFYFLLVFAFELAVQNYIVHLPAESILNIAFGMSQITMG
jgi:hypothetical protein